MMFDAKQILEWIFFFLTVQIIMWLVSSPSMDPQAEDIKPQ